MASVPTVRQFVAGEIEVASNLNAGLGAAVQFMLAPPMCIVSNSVNQNVVNATSVPLGWNTEAYDPTNMHSGTSSHIQPLYPGWYVATGTVFWSSNADSNQRQVSIRVNGSLVVAEQDNPAINGFGMAQSVTSIPVLCNGTSDYFEMVVFQRSGGTLTAGVASVLTVRFASA